MKKFNIVLILVFVLSICFAQAQTTTGKMSDKGRLALAVWVPDQDRKYASYS